MTYASAGNEYWYGECGMELVNSYIELLKSIGFVCTYSDRDGTFYEDYSKDGVAVNVFRSFYTGHVCIEPK